jgi:hypothetical protein
MGRQVFAPKPLGRHSPPDRDDRKHDGKSGQRKKQYDRGAQGLAIFLFKRIKKIPVPVVEPILRQQLQSDDPEERRTE